MKSPLRDAAFTHFHDRFRGDPLVLDKWMGLQAGSPLPETVTAVRALMKHPAFDIKNPNRVRALIGAFTVNHLRFHAGDGAGYRLVGEVIRTLDRINPQVAARMAGAFESWRRYDGERQALMRAEMETIAEDGRAFRQSLRSHDEDAGVALCDVDLRNDSYGPQMRAQ